MRVGKRVGDPAAGVVHEDIDRPECLFGSVKDTSWCGDVVQIGLDRQSDAAVRVNRRGHVRPVARALLTICLGDNRIGLRCQTQIREKDAGTAAGERKRRCSTDTVIASGHDGHVSA